MRRSKRAAGPAFFYCEVGGASHTEHIRPAGSEGIKTGGGVDTASLCGAPIRWDVHGEVTKTEAVNRSTRTWWWGSPQVCAECAALLPGGTS